MSETYSALREYRKRIKAMLDDPECTGDLFSLGVALPEVVPVFPKLRLVLGGDAS